VIVPGNRWTASCIARCDVLRCCFAYLKFWSVARATLCIEQLVWQTGFGKVGATCSCLSRDMLRGGLHASCGCCCFCSAAASSDTCASSAGDVQRRDPERSCRPASLGSPTHATRCTFSTSPRLCRNRRDVMGLWSDSGSAVFMPTSRCAVTVARFDHE